MDEKPEDPNDKPRLLRALELILADPAVIKRQAERLHERYRKKFGDEKTEDEIRRLTAKRKSVR